jgi:hypothetical protein
MLYKRTQLDGVGMVILLMMQKIFSIQLTSGRCNMLGGRCNMLGGQEMRLLIH